jgi:DNA (cytosine-5)-methyltransferase 1
VTYQFDGTEPEPSNNGDGWREWNAARRMKRPLLLDLFCKQGGAAMGYHYAGFDVIGVDIEPQPLYPFEFIQADALEFLASDHPAVFMAAVRHASPPCQAYSSLKSMTDGSHPDLVVPVRWALQSLGGTYVIENVVGAPLADPVMLCGSTFDLGAVCMDGKYRQLRRHRLFESNLPLQPRRCQHIGQAVGVYGTGGGGQMTRGYKADKNVALDAMGTPWMDRKGVSQAIPPAYTEFIGKQLLAQLAERAA